jgi:hypothetical protein
VVGAPGGVPVASCDCGGVGVGTGAASLATAGRGISGTPEFDVGFCTIEAICGARGQEAETTEGADGIAGAAEVAGWPPLVSLRSRRTGPPASAG